MKALLVMLALAGCSHDSRQTTIRAALTSAEVADAGYKAARGPVELAYVKGATSEPNATARLADFQHKRALVDDAFVVLFRSIAVALTLNDDQSLAAMVAAGIEVQKLVTELEGSK